MALLGLLAGAGLRLLTKKKQSARVPTYSGMTAQEEQDLGITGGYDNIPTGASAPAGGGTAVVPFGKGGLGMIQTKPTMVQRAKCPRGYSGIVTGGTQARPTVVCVLTKVARALGLVHRRRGRGLSARDLRAAVRVQRLVHRLGPKFGGHRRSGGHGHGCACPRCKGK
jgi:hypothetical protein